MVENWCIHGEGDKTAAVQRIDSGKERLRGGVLLTLCAALVHLLEVVFPLPPGAPVFFIKRHAGEGARVPRPRVLQGITELHRYVCESCYVIGFCTFCVLSGLRTPAGRSMMHKTKRQRERLRISVSRWWKRMYEAPITRPPVPHYYSSLTVCGCRRHSLFGVRWVFLSRNFLRRRIQEDKSEETLFSRDSGAAGGARGSSTVAGAQTVDRWVLVIIVSARGHNRTGLPPCLPVNCL
ncbi:hypothetical protein E2C01_011428 [Portunus trituberculatus]|uniref:Uncharacterized protein n=1 Tax=Portunus trituberculatus TaxID=210409 RepID=A0A5B7DB63_PORTR|nr:hypothetical protein [Portunus trituberculatus]